MKPILVVDDEAIVRESIAAWLKDAGYEVETAETGEEAIEILGKRHFGVVVLDVRLPGKTGLTVFREIKAVKPQIKFIVITAYPTAEYETDAKELGALAFLIKPVLPEQLETLVREAIAHTDLS